MSTTPNKLSEERHEMLPVARHYVRVVYTSMTERSLTMSGSTGEVHWRTLQLVSLAVTRIEFGSLHAIDKCQLVVDMAMRHLIK